MSANLRGPLEVRLLPGGRSPPGKRPSGLADSTLGPGGRSPPGPGYMRHWGWGMTFGEDETRDRCGGVVALFFFCLKLGPFGPFGPLQDLEG